MKNKKITSLLVVAGMLAATVGSIGFVVYAQSVPTTAPIVNQQASLETKTKITTEQAKAVALGKVSGTVTSVQLEDEDGAPVYEVTVGTQEVEVNALDGSIIKIEKADNENGSHESDNQNENSEKGNKGNN